MRTALLLTLATLAFGQGKLPPAANRKIDFEKEVQPILSQKCFACHGEEAQQSGLRLDKRQNALRGGDYGPVIVMGKSADSKLIRRLVGGDGGLQMPPTGPLSDDEIGILRAWIDQGADYRNQVEDEAPPKPINPKLAALIAAVRSADVKGVTALIDANPSLVNAPDAAGATPLHHAAGFGNLATVKLLLDRGAEVNAGNKRKSTPLFWCLNNESKVRVLLERGANVNAKSNDGRTPVYQAASMPNALPVLRLLLDKGGDANAKTLTGMTPLMAASRVSTESARLLLERKAEVNAKNAAGATALMSAAQTGRPEAVRLLLEKGAEVNVRTKRNESALADAATAGNDEVVRLLLERDAEVNVQDLRGYSPLMYAAGSDTIPVAVVKMLLAKGANQNATGEGETALTLAAKRGDSTVARALGATEGDRKATVTAMANRNVSAKPIAEAVGTALALLEKQSHNFIRIGGCNSCHAQDLPSAAAAIARHRGLPAPKEIPQLPQSMHTLNAERLMDLTPVSVAGMGWEMFDFGNNRVPRNEYTDATVHYLKSMQTPGGNWDALEGRRPPMNSGIYQATALAIYTLKTYGSPADDTETSRAIARAGAWLEHARPSTTQDRAFHLLGLAWANAKAGVIADFSKALAAEQRADGGWSQMPSMSSDAYATGQALYSLNTAGMPVGTPVYGKGVKYLLGTQAADGSWHVRSRSIWIQPYFESGFPYGHDQWISAAGTSWATMALSATVDHEPVTVAKNPARPAKPGR